MFLPYIIDVPKPAVGANNEPYDQVWDCHAERSEESVSSAVEILRCAQHDSPDIGCKTSLSA
jgi:hypothetical protein